MFRAPFKQAHLIRKHTVGKYDTGRENIYCGEPAYWTEALWLRRKAKGNSFGLNVWIAARETIARVLVWLREHLK
jgi:hypothetical protein